MLLELLQVDVFFFSVFDFALRIHHGWMSRAGRLVVVHEEMMLTCMVYLQLKPTDKTVMCILHHCQHQHLSCLHPMCLMRLVHQVWQHRPCTPVPGTAMVAAPATPVPPVPATPSVAAPATPAERSKATSARIRVSRAPAPHVATPAAPSVAPVPSVAAAAPRPAPATPAQPLPAPATPAPSVAAPGTPAPSAPATPMSHAPAIVGASAKSKARPPPPPPSNDEHEEHVSEQLSDGDWSPSHLLSDGEEAESLQSDGEEAEPEVAPADEEENGLTCGICLQPHGKEAVESLECGHVFHSACLDTWFRTAEPTPDPHACPNRCHTFLRRQHVSPTLAEEQADEQAFDAEMMELFG